MPEEPIPLQFAEGTNIAQASSGGTAIVVRYEYAPPKPVDQAVLDAAQQRLTALPLGTIPNPAPLPNGSRILFSPNYSFVGREDELKALAASFRGGDTAVIGQLKTAAVSGLGGIGKTQLASEFTHRYGQYFTGGVFWLSFNDPTAVPAEVAHCGGAGGMRLRPDFYALPLEDQVREVLSAWQSAMPRLLVFDNCEDEELLAKWRPPTGGCRILVTSRRDRWDPILGVRTLPLDVLSRNESVALLRKARPDQAAEDPNLHDIAQELGDLPLALDLAGRHLAKYHLAVTPDQYLEELRRPDLLEHPSLREGGISPTGHEQHVARTFALSYEQLETEDPVDALAIALLARAARFAPGEPIPRDLLLSALDLEDNDPDATLRAEDALSRLTELGLLQTQEARALRLHPLVATFVNDTVANVGIQESVESALLQKARTLVEEGYRAPLLVLEPHLRNATEAAQEREDEQAAQLCRYLALCLQTMGDYSGAIPYAERALAIYEQVLGVENFGTADALTVLAMILRDQEDYAEARPHLERALKIIEEVQGAEDLVIAIGLYNLASVLEAQGERAKACNMYKRALEIHENAHEGEHIGAAAVLSNLGTLRLVQGERERARRLYERALQIYENKLGPNHPATAVVLTNLGSLLKEQDRYRQARPYLKRSLDIIETARGAEHTDTAACLNNLATLLDNQAESEDNPFLQARAHRLLERALQICGKTLGAHHSYTKQVRRNLLALLLRNSGSYRFGREPKHTRDG